VADEEVEADGLGEGEVDGEVEGDGLGEVDGEGEVDREGEVDGVGDDKGGAVVGPDVSARSAEGSVRLGDGRGAADVRVAGGVVPRVVAA
jgi:hypothetical protein